MGRGINAERSYPIHFSGSREALKAEVQKLREAGRSVRVISDARVLDAQPDYLPQIGFEDSEILSLSSGEKTKSIDCFSQALSFLANQSCNRDCALFAFGGAFWQPKTVYIDTALLQNLPPREFAAGMAEVIKYGMLADTELLADLETYGGLSADSSELPDVIRRCCAIKARIVAEDEKETAGSGGRALLNLGHTFAHAIENVAGYGAYLHGEAVAIGLVLATRLSVELGQLRTETIEQVESLIRTYQLPTRLSKPLSADELIAAMYRDKKTLSGKLRFVTMTALGNAITSEGVELKLVEEVWAEASN